MFAYSVQNILPHLLKKTTILICRTIILSILNSSVSLIYNIPKQIVTLGEIRDELI
jgi:hypothetical protein